MKKLLTLIACTLVLASVGNILAEEAPVKVVKKVAHTTTVKPKVTELEIKVIAGEVEAIRLPARMGTGFSWKLTEVDQQIVEGFKNKLVRVKLKLKNAKETDKPTFKEYQVFFLKGKSAGKHNATFTYKRHWDDNDKPLKEVKITLDISEAATTDESKDATEKDLPDSKK
jgi:predicted secreted protein